MEAEECEAIVIPLDTNKIEEEKMSKQSEYAPLKLEKREDSDTWETEKIEFHLHVPVRSPLLGQATAELVKKYGIMIETPESDTLRPGDLIILKGEAHKVTRASDDLFPAE